MLSYGGAGVISLVAAWRHVSTDWRYLRQNMRLSSKYIGLASLSNLLYFVAIYLAFNSAGEDRGLAAILTNAQVVTTVLVAAVLLRERDNLVRKVVAAVLVLAASYLISGI